MNKLSGYLDQLGFSKIEAKLYISLLETGPLSVKELAERTKINRTASYTHIASLLEKGVIAEITGGPRKKLIASEPERLRYLIVRKLEDLNALEAKFPVIVNTIHASITREPIESIVHSKYYKGLNGIKAICHEALKANELRCYANLIELENIFLAENDKDIFEKALERNKKMKIFELIAGKPSSVAKYNLEDTHQKGRYYYKFMPTDLGLTSGTMLYDNKIAVINIKDVSGIVLSNVDYYNNSKKLFDYIWSTLPEPNHRIHT